MLKEFFLGTVLAIFAIVLPNISQATEQGLSFNKLVVFGDSLSDNGNMLKLSQDVIERLPEFMRRFAKEIPDQVRYCHGRFSTGPVWDEYLAFDLFSDPGLDSQCSENLPGPRGRGFAALENYAYGGAKSGNLPIDIEGKIRDQLPHRVIEQQYQQQLANTENLSRLPNLEQVLAGKRDYLAQVNYDMRTKMVGMSLQIKEYIATHVDSGDYTDSLFALWIGGNDYVDYLNPGKIPTEEQIDEVIAHIRDAMQALIEQGANKFMVFNLPDLTKSPKGLSEQYGVIGRKHNQALKQLVLDLKTQYSQVKIAEVDVEANLDKLLEPEQGAELRKKYGITNITDACVGDVVTEYDCTGYMFTDDVHPTTNVHRLIADVAKEALHQVGL